MSIGTGRGRAKVELTVIRGSDHPTPRETFLVLLAGGPIMPPDAVVLLVGEDAEPRMMKAVGRWAELRQWAIHKRLFDPETNDGPYQPMMVVTGGRHDGERFVGAKEIVPDILAQGVDFERILIDSESQNTHEQAESVVELAQVHGWKRLMLVASPYHTPRAFLTFLKELQDKGLEKEIELFPDSADQAPWFGSPEGATERRIDLFTNELAKIRQYADHVASYDDAIDYLQYWELHVPEQKGHAA